MAVRDWLTRAFGAKASVIGLSADELPDRPLEKGFDDATLLTTYRDDAWPYVLANKGAEQASQAPLVVGRMVAGEFERVPENHPVQQLLDSPNPQMDGGEFIHLLWVYMELAGHAPIEVVKPEGGGIIGAPGRRGTRVRAGFELWLVNPGPWRIVANRDASIKGYLWLRTSDSALKWTPEQMTYLRWPNPADRWYGQGRIAAIRNEVMAEEYAAIRDKKFEKNLGVPPGILSSEMPLGEVQAAELQKRWEVATGGYRNAGKIAVLGSKTSYQQITPNSREAEWLAQRKWRVETQAAAFGIPVPLIIMQDAKFANLQGARAEFWEGTLQPRLNRIARMVTHRLLPLITSEPLVAKFEYGEIEALGENDLEAAQTAKEWANTGAVTVGEIRKRLSLEPLPDKAANERLLVPTTLQLQTTDEIATSAALGAQGQQASIDTTLNPPAPKAEPVPRRRGKGLEGAAQEAILDPLRETWKRDLGSFFAAQHSALTPAFRKALPEDEGRAILDRVVAILSEIRFRDRLKRISEGPIAAAITLGANEAATLLGIDVSFSIPASQDALAFLTTHLEQLSAGIQNTTLEEVRAVLEKTLRAGASNAGIRAELGKLFDGYQDWRLDRISLTETRAAYNLGAIKQYRTAGVSLVNVIDGDDALCADWNGRTVTLDEAENSPLGHPNCRRTWIPITTDLGRGEFTEDASLEAAAIAAVTKVATAAIEAVHQQPVSVTIAEGAVQNHTTVEASAPPNVQVAAPVVNLPETPVTFTQAPISVAAPSVTVEAADMTPVAKAVATLRGDMAELKAEVRKPRTRRLLKDDLGRPIGSEEV